jgi:hypothetical protein
VQQQLLLLGQRVELCAGTCRVYHAAVKQPMQVLRGWDWLGRCLFPGPFSTTQIEQSTDLHVEETHASMGDECAYSGKVGYCFVLSCDALTNPRRIVVIVACLL